MKGWLYCKNLRCNFGEKGQGTIEKSGEGLLYTNLLDKFYHDTIKCKDGFLLDGYISNKNELFRENGIKDWEKLYRVLCKDDAFPDQLRGGFSGSYYNEDGGKVFFVDHLGSKPLFYCSLKDKFVISSNLGWVIEILTENKIQYHFNELAAKYMLTYGYMLDDTTFICEIKRVLPGNKIVVKEENCDIIQYYCPTITHPQNMTEDEAVYMIDKAFRKAVKREFDKDREYGYEHLVDLSGGLDSRMVAWVAHEMGYTKQTNYTYCKAKYLDFKISSRIASDLQHEYYFKQLDDFQWIYEIEDNLKLNNGSALFCAITGGRDCLANFDKKRYGIEHTGMLGDVIISCFAEDEQNACKAPGFGSNQYSTLLSYDFSQELLDKYENQEIFDVYTRGFLGAMSTYPIRQNYFEVGSPFLDVDFIEACFSVPVKYRKNHNIYLKWMKQFYKRATKYGWEKWAGIPPKKELGLVRDGMFAIRKVRRMVRSLCGYAINDTMNPIDFWYAKDEKTQNFFESYFNKNINNACISQELREDITRLFKEGSAEEKMQAITVLGMLQLYFSGDEKWKRI